MPGKAQPVSEEGNRAQKQGADSYESVEDCARLDFGNTLGSVMLIASDLAAIIIVVISTVLVVVGVLGLHIWGAIQDGREEKAMWGWRHRRRG